MKKYLFYIVKYVRWIYSLYYYLGTFFLKVLKLFVKPNDKLILFISFGGKKFDDSPKSIYDALLKDKRFDSYNIVWAFNNPEKYKISRGKKIKTDTLNYFITALKARIWITNSSVERGLSFKGKHTFYFNTWHGTPLKKMGIDIASTNKSFVGKGKSNYDIFTAQGEYEANIFSRVFNIKQENMKIIGLPRNDVFSSYSTEYRDEIKKQLDIPLDKKVILYAPTFREYESNGGMERVLSVPMQIEKWKKELSDKYVLLFRAHYEVAKSMDVIDDSFIRNMSNYPSLEDLMIVSDMLISDYSSMFFDYSIMHKPMLCFAYDYEKYSNERGMYFDIREYIPTATNEDDLITLIKNTCVLENIFAKRFQERFVTEYGNASNKALNIIAKELIEHN